MNEFEKEIERAFGHAIGSASVAPPLGPAVARRARWRRTLFATALMSSTATFLILGFIGFQAVSSSSSQKSSSSDLAGASAVGAECSNDNAEGVRWKTEPWKIASGVLDGDSYVLCARVATLTSDGTTADALCMEWTLGGTSTNMDCYTKDLAGPGYFLVLGDCRTADVSRKHFIGAVTAKATALEVDTPAGTNVGTLYEAPAQFGYSLNFFIASGKTNGQATLRGLDKAGNTVVVEQSRGCVDDPTTVGD